jgi:hypothetical protein
MGRRIRDQATILQHDRERDACPANPPRYIVSCRSSQGCRCRTGLPSVPVRLPRALFAGGFSGWACNRGQNRTSQRRRETRRAPGALPFRGDAIGHCPRPRVVEPRGTPAAHRPSNSAIAFRSFGTRASARRDRRPELISRLSGNQAVFGANRIRLVIPSRSAGGRGHPVAFRHRSGPTGPRPGSLGQRVRARRRGPSRGSYLPTQADGQLIPVPGRAAVRAIFPGDAAPIRSPRKALGQQQG